MATPKKLPSGNWRVRVFVGMDGDKKVYKSFTAKTKGECSFLASEYIVNRKEEEENGRTIREAVNNYIASRTAISSPTTIKNYKSICAHHLDGIGDKYASKVTTAEMQSLVNDLASNHSPKTVKNIVYLILAAMELECPNRRFRLTFPTKKTVEYHIPTEENVKQLIKEADGDLKKSIVLSSVGTLRRGEICAIKYGDIQSNTIKIHADLVKNEFNEWIYKDIPKTSQSIRIVEYPKQVIDMLGKGDPDEFVIKANPDNITNSFVRLRKKLGLKCRFHDLRHYAASIMHAIGVPDQYIMERGGWKSDAILKSVYRNTLSDKQKEFSDRTNSYMSGLFD